MTGTDIAVADEPQAGTLALRGDQIEWSPVQQAALVHIGIAEAPPGDQQVFMHVCQRTGLDPWSKQIYMIGRNDRDAPSGKKWTIQTGIDGFRLIAERHPQYRGQLPTQWCGPDGAWQDVWLDPQKPPVAARVGVLRGDREQPVWGVALYREYVQTTTWNGRTEPTKMWREKGAHMVAKCAEALAIRKAFPQEVGGLHTDDEMAAADRRPAAAVSAPGPAVTAAELTGAVVDADPCAEPTPGATTSSPGKPAPAGREAAAAAGPTDGQGPPQSAPAPRPAGPAPSDGEPLARPVQLRQLAALCDEAEIPEQDRARVTGLLLGATVTDWSHLTIAQAQTATDELRRLKKAGHQQGLPGAVADLLAGVETRDPKVNARMFALLGDAGLGGDDMRDRRLALIGNVIGEAVTTTSGMTDQQRSAVISALERYQRDGDLDDAESRAQEDAAYAEMEEESSGGSDGAEEAGPDDDAPGTDA